MSNINDIVTAERWMPSLDIGHPIFPEDVKGFTKWVMYGGFKKYHNSGRHDESHLGHDFVSHLDEEQVEHFRLHSDTPVRAVADGVVKSIIRNNGRFSEYETYLIVQHNELGLVSGYVHVVPQVNIGDEVRKGQVLATLYDTSVEAMSLPTHLHLELGNAKVQNESYPFFNDLVDPLNILPGLKEMSVKPVSPFFPYAR
ncbi:MAG: M23 family metallopeptidase [Nanoarchaeota archaeon]|nr:M23 family metallopeptidase [Nanoarchaeota archaeon]MBU1031016.1 M23 family metallopeptidase [Nanoarchaeota archaeon]